MPWIREDRLYPIIVLLLIFIMAVRMPMDSDMWWHLRAGEETLSSGEVYQVDTFSSTRSGERWINHSWLSQVMMALMVRIGGRPALSIWVASCAVLSMGLVYLLMSGHPLLRSAVLILAAMVSSVVWSPRPQIMSLVFLALISWLVQSYLDKPRWGYLVAVPAVFVLWGNLHGGYVLGLIYLGAVICGGFLDRIMLEKRADSTPWKNLGYLAAVMLLGFLFVLLNPNGIDMWKIPFNTIGVETLQNLINEWASPDFHQAFQQPFLWMLLGLFIVLGLNGQSVQGKRLVPVVIFAWAALVARRNFGPFAIVGAPLLAEQLSLLLDEWISKARQSFLAIEKFLVNAETSKENFNMTARNMLNVVLIGLLIAAAVIKTCQVNQTELVAKTEKKIFPVGAAEWIKSQDQPVKVFNDYNWGGYLIYHLDDPQVFVDGRTDLYGDEILSNYLDVIYGEENWQELLSAYDIHTLLVPSDSLLVRTAIKEGWRLVYGDPVSAIMRFP